MRYLLEESHKTLPKDIKEELNKQRDTPGCIERLTVT